MPCPCLRIEQEDGISSGIEPAVVGGRRSYRPTNLLGAIWEQFFIALEEGKEFRRCLARSCQTEWFEVSTGPQGVREDAEFCSARCRHTAYRDRKKQARDMRRDGRPLRTIAQTLNTDVARDRPRRLKRSKFGYEFFPTRYIRLANINREIRCRPHGIGLNVPHHTHVEIVER